MSSAVGPSAARDDVLVRRENGILIVTINRPDQRNAVNGAVVRRHRPRARPARRRVRAAGRGCCTATAPPSARAWTSRRSPPGSRSGTRSRGFAGLVERPPAKPLIAAVEGWALGGGFEIVLACDLVTAGKSARFGLPEVRRGLAARGGGVFRLPRRLPHALAMELIVTGAPLDADQGRAVRPGQPAGRRRPGARRRARAGRADRRERADVGARLEGGRDRVGRLAAGRGLPAAAGLPGARVRLAGRGRRRHGLPRAP